MKSSCSIFQLLFSPHQDFLPWVRCDAVFVWRPLPRIHCNPNVWLCRMPECRRDPLWDWSEEEQTQRKLFKSFEQKSLSSTKTIQASPFWENRLVFNMSSSAQNFSNSEDRLPWSTAALHLQPECRKGLRQQ